MTFLNSLFQIQSDWTLKCFRDKENRSNMLKYFLQTEATFKCFIMHPRIIFIEILKAFRVYKNGLTWMTLP